MLDVPLSVAGESQQLGVELHVGNPTPGSLELPIGGPQHPRGTRNSYGTYDAKGDAAVQHDGKPVTVRGMLNHMTTRKSRSARAAEARDAVNAARGAVGEDPARRSSPRS